MKNKTFRYFVGDFETTVYENQESTEVWASALVELFDEDVKIFHSIGETFEYFKSLNCNICVYYHNLKFDGSFWLSYLLCDLHLEQATIKTGKDEFDLKFLSDMNMKNNTFKYSISDMGQWYTITIKVHNHYIVLRDSLKLLPFKVAQIGQSFKTKHQKLDMEYEGYRYAGCEITDEEKKYIANDVLVVKEALEIMFTEGHKKLTIGSCCLEEYRKIIGWEDYKVFFPNIYEIKIDKEVYGSENAGEYIRKSYRGGWCYLVKGKENQIKTQGTTADVNSLYPSMMSSESGNLYPVGKPRFWKGNRIPLEAKLPDKYYFIRIKTRFYIKKNKLPCIQIKNSLYYFSREWLETSDVRNPRTGNYCKTMVDKNGNTYDTKVTLTLTMTDYKLICDHYDLVDCEILDGCWFNAEIGLFDDYIETYKKKKLENTGALRELAKLFLNNLYGKMATSTNSSFKYAYVKEDQTIGFVEIREYNKLPGYIPVGSAITSYARNFTIRAAQKNYYGKNNRGFIYADTDSIHCDLPADEIKGITVHSKNFCCWKLEASWDVAIFTRQKTYIEHVTHENLEKIETPYYNVKCAGMPENCKQLFLMSMKDHLDEKELENLEPIEREFVLTHRDLTDFKVGLIVPGKLRPQRIRGGVLLVKTTYEMR